MPVVGGNRVSSFGSSHYIPPPQMRGLLALNPKLAGYVAYDAGLRAFLEKNLEHLVAEQPKGAVHDDVELETWCHATTIVPPAVRDEEYIVVVARGSSYATTGDIEIPLTSGGKGTSDGRILFVGKTRDYLGTFKDDHDAHYPGAGAVTLSFPVYGNAGEKVELTYCRIKPDDQGRAHPSQSAWPDSFDGVYGGYSGRDRSVVLKGGARPHIECPP